MRRRNVGKFKRANSVALKAKSTDHGPVKNDPQDDPVTAKARLRRLWTEELYREYDNLLFQFRLKLAPPLIIVADLAGVWGRWHAVTRAITINAALIERYSWDVVLEVLKHEVAHQIVSEVMGGDHTHGDAFKRAAAKLGLSEWATRAAGDLPDEIPNWKDRALSADEEKLLRRAEKLLALATSTNEHEALLAMRHVRVLYERHNLERLDARRAARMVHLLIGRGKKRMDAAEQMIGSILVEHFFVKVIFSDTYDARTGERHKVLEVMGAEENVLMAEYVHHFLYRETTALWAAFKRTHGKSEAAKASYMRGVLAGFRDKLARDRKTGFSGETPPTTPDAPLAQSRDALVALGAKELDQFVATRHPRLVSRSVGRSNFDRSSFAAGQVAGEKLNLRKAVSENQGNRGRFLTG